MDLRKGGAYYNNEKGGLIITTRERGAYYNNEYCKERGGLIITTRTGKRRLGEEGMDEEKRCLL